LEGTKKTPRNHKCKFQKCDSWKENKTLESKKNHPKVWMKYGDFFLKTQMSSKKVVVDEICTFIFLHKFHPKELQLGDFKKPLKSTTFIQKTYHLDKVI
jgi:hypothetical protein